MLLNTRALKILSALELMNEAYGNSIDRSCEIYTTTTNQLNHDTFIQVNQTITSTSLISENLNVTVDAGESINLLEDFEVQPNSIFEALINGFN